MEVKGCIKEVCFWILLFYIQTERIKLLAFLFIHQACESPMQTCFLRVVLLWIFLNKQKLKLVCTIPHIHKLIQGELYMRMVLYFALFGLLCSSVSKCRMTAFPFDNINDCNIFPFLFPPSKPSQYPSLLSYKLIASFLLIAITYTYVFLNINYLDHVLLLVCTFSELTIWHRKTNLYTLPWRR